MRILLGITYNCLIGEAEVTPCGVSSGGLRNSSESRPFPFKTFEILSRFPGPLLKTNKSFPTSCLLKYPVHPEFPKIHPTYRHQIFQFSRLYWIRWKICTSSCPLTSPSLVWRGNEGRPNLPKTVMRQNISVNESQLNMYHYIDGSAGVWSINKIYYVP